MSFRLVLFNGLLRLVKRDVARRPCSIEQIQRARRLMDHHGAGRGRRQPVERTPDVLNGVRFLTGHVGRVPADSSLRDVTFTPRPVGAA